MNTDESVLWSVYVKRDSERIFLGHVLEPNETLAELAALIRFSPRRTILGDDEESPKGLHIYPGESFTLHKA